MLHDRSRSLSVQQAAESPGAGTGSGPDKAVWVCVPFLWKRSFPGEGTKGLERTSVFVRGHTASREPSLSWDRMSGFLLLIRASSHPTRSPPPLPPSLLPTPAGGICPCCISPPNRAPPADVSWLRLQKLWSCLGGAQYPLATCQAQALPWVTPAHRAGCDMKTLQHPALGGWRNRSGPFCRLFPHTGAHRRQGPGAACLWTKP